MYNLSGIYYEMIWDGVVFGIASAAYLISSQFWNKKNRKKKNFLIGVLYSIILVCSLRNSIDAINNSQISVHKGYFVKEERINRYPFQLKYIFVGEDGTKEWLELNVFSKKNIYPEQFKKDAWYKIYYEEESDIIVRVENIGIRK